MNDRALPLQGIGVLDLTQARAGPTAARQLADWGADVLKIEAPPDLGKDSGLGGHRQGADFLNLHRNKRGLTLNLKAKEGKAIFYRLVSRSDVVIENYRPKVKHRLGIDYASVSLENPRIVYGSISGFGQDGPYSDRAGVDQIAQGMGGLMSITGLPGQGPVRVGIPIADLSAGLLLAQGILLALFERERSGRGQWVSTSLLEAQIAMLDFQAARFLIDDEVPPQAGNNHPTGIPTGVFPTADGSINIAAAGKPMWLRLVHALGAPELAEHELYRSSRRRYENRDALNEELSRITRTRSSEHWIALLNDAGVPTGAINDVGQTFSDPQVRHLKMYRPMETRARGEVNVVAQPIRMSRTSQPESLRSPPEIGEHTADILADLGYTPEDVARMRKEQVV